MIAPKNAINQRRYTIFKGSMENNNSDSMSIPQVLGHINESKPRFKIGDETNISHQGAVFRVKILKISSISFLREYKVEFLEDKSQKWLLESDLCHNLN